ncbi:archaea-specific SMC-related protein [Halomarina oriensis]|uniref:Chromosome segregation protein SMC n=1 Tax=Halomarina oriensis TaxID=671145 RepID=A0A6B0GET8_9EURY|nr:archaea-specific SMC-related protein [Halomarina oriensis]MWG33456.1 chromosome segregation protein SMC [Halomarina oriensis]
MDAITTPKESASVAVQNIGGIDDTAVDIPPGVTVLTGRNATNRTSLLQAIMAAMGSDNASVKGDAETGTVELEIGENTYTRTLTRSDGTVVTDGEPYAEDPVVADLFAFLLESNEARRAVAQGRDLRELIMRPVDVDAIRAAISEHEAERDRIDDELEELESLKGDLPTLEERRTSLQSDIEEKRSDLEAKEAEIEAYDGSIEASRDEQEELEDRLEALRDQRSELDRIRSEIDLQEKSIESLTSERHELEAERKALPELSADEEDLQRKISRLRSQKSRLEERVSDLQDVISFNEEMLDETESEMSKVLQDSRTDGAVTDQLVEDESVVCWTCGTEVEEERIEDTLEKLRSVRTDTLSDVREIEDELNELQETKREREQHRRQQERLTQKHEEVTDELDRRREEIETLREKRDRLGGEIESLETAVEELESDDFDEILELHKEANELEFELGRLESEAEDVTDRIAAIEESLTEEERLRAERESVTEELQDLRTRIDRIEEQAVEQFNDHMDAVLEILGYENLERIWIERVQKRVREGRQKVDRTVFELHVVRSTASGATYEDTIDHLSESEREVTGLVFGLAGYLVHDVHETVPFVLLDSLEAIDSERIADLVEYIAEYASYLVVALLPEDARVLDDSYTRITEI